MLVEAIMNMMTELESFIYGKYDLANIMSNFASSDGVTYLTEELGYEEWDMEHEMFKSWIPSVCFVFLPQKV